MCFLLSFPEFHYIWPGNCKSDTVFNYQPNSGVERHGEFQPAISLLDGRGWESRCTSTYMQ